MQDTALAKMQSLTVAVVLQDYIKMLESMLHYIVNEAPC